LRQTTTVCERTYSSGVVNSGIPDVGGTSVGIDVPEDGLVVTDVNLTVNVHHTRDSDLILKLYSETDAPSPTTRHIAVLFNHYGGTGDNLTGTTFDDSATTAISSGSAPFTGEFTPDEALSVFDGDTGGQWRLTAGDDTSGETGWIVEWSITFRYASCDEDADGVEDHVDACPDLGGDVATGCPVASAHLGAAYRNGRFRGSLLSPVPGCKAGRPVTIWKVRRGPDRLIGTVTTRPDGAYRLVRPRRPGRYYATSPAHLVPTEADCLPAHSARFRVL
jgi:subtilisin-like proprotein convertase family protein